MRFFPIWAALLLTGVGLVNYLKDDLGSKTYQVAARNEVDLSHFAEEVDRGNIVQVRFQSNRVYGFAPDAEVPHISTAMPSDPENLLEYLLKKNVRVAVDDQNRLLWRLIEQLLQLIVPLALIFGISILVWHRRRFFGISDNPASTSEIPDAKFSDVAGIGHAKESLAEVVEFLKFPEKFKKLGAKVPRGVLLHGPPGTGKTLLARCVAGESGAYFMHVSGASFVEIYVGMGARKVRATFEEMKKHSPCILFIDEFDALAGARQNTMTGTGADEYTQTVCQLLEAMDGFKTNWSGVVIGATNRREAIDPAILRPGRFDRVVYVGNPDLNDRREIFEVHLKSIIHGDINLDVLAKKTQGFSGADIKNLVNEAAIIATRHDKDKVEMDDFENAWGNILLGPVRSKCRTEEQKRLTAYHEVGHAIITESVPSNSSVHTVTIVPRGSADGHVLHLPDKEEDFHTFESLVARIMIALAGRAAEELVFGSEKVTNGASEDLAYVTALAHRMVFEWGMAGSDNLVQYKYRPELPINIPLDTINTREAVANRIIKDAYDRVLAILTKSRPIMDKVVSYLMDRETLTGDEFRQLMRGEDLPEPTNA